MEETSVQTVLDDSPNSEADHPVCRCDQRVVEVSCGEVCSIDDWRKPKGRHHVPGSLGERLQEVSK